MIKQVFYKGFYGTDAIDFVKGLINVYPFGELGKRYAGQIKMHAHNNLFQVFYINEGTTMLTFNNTEVEINAPALITIPKNMPHGFIHQTEVLGWMLSLSDLVLEQILQREAEIIFELDSVLVHQLDNEDENTKTIIYTLDQIVSEYYADKPGRMLMIQNLVIQLLVGLFRIPDPQRTSLSGNDNASKVYFRRYQQLIRHHHNFSVSIENYSNELGITPGHLNRVCQSISQQTPKEIVLDYFVNEAKRMLMNIETSITEIAYELGFEDPGYFTRLFKKRTGSTPRAYREAKGIKSSLGNLPK